jgi:hypothetical protein
MSNQEMSDTIRALIAQVAQMASALDTANTKLASLSQTCEGARKSFDDRMNAAEIKIASVSETAHRSNKHIMKLVNETAIPSTVFTNNRKDWTTWSRTMKVYLDCKYSGFRRMLEWAETREEEITTTLVDGTQWQYARESNGQLYKFLFTVTTTKAQAMINNMDPTMGYECWRKIAQFYDPPGGEGELDKINVLLNTKRCDSLGKVVSTIETWEKDWSHYVEKTKETLPEKWKVNLSLRMIPKNFEHDIRFRYVHVLRHNVCAQRVQLNTLREQQRLILLVLSGKQRLKAFIPYALVGCGLIDDH